MSKISAYPAASALAGTETLPVVQSGTTKKALVSDFKTYMGLNDAEWGNMAVNLSGMTFDQSVTVSSTTVAGAADRFELYPFVPSHDVAISSIGLEVTTAVAASNSKVVVYDANATSRVPGTLLKETGNLDSSTTGLKTEAWSTTLKKGKLYWVGFRSSSTQTFRGINTSAMRSIGRPTSTGGAGISFRISLAFATAAPSPFGANAAIANISGGVAAAIIMTIA